MLSFKVPLFKGGKMVREFKLINEKGQVFSLMDIYKYCLLTEPSGLGYSYITEYQQLGNTFISNLRNMAQGQISGTLNFINYDNYTSFVNFIESSESLRFGYKIPYKDGSTKEYFKDVEIQTLEKTQLQTNGILSEAVTFECLSLWYEENTVIYTIEPQTNEIRWDFEWDSRFIDYDTRTLQYINQGHVEAPIYVEIDGQIINPKIELYVEGELYQTVAINIDIAQYEKLLYDSRENQFFIGKQNTDGSKTSLFSLDYIDFGNDNVIRLPKNRSCEIRLTADNEVLNAKLTIYPRYKAV